MAALSDAQRDDVNRQLDRIVQVRTEANSISWVSFSVFAAAAALLAQSITGARTSHDIIPPLTGIVLSGVGLATSGVWFVITRRLIKLLNDYEVLIVKLQGKLGLENEDMFYKSQLKEVSPGAILRGEVEDTTRWLMSRVPVASGIAWALVLGYFVYHFFH